MLATRCLAMVAAISTVACASVTELECDLECGEHEACELTEGTPTCECVAGYDGTPCEWVGVIRDPEFENPDVWEVTKGVTVRPIEDQVSGKEGSAFFSAAALCAAGSVSQIVEMPRYEDAEPLVAQVRFRNQRASPTVLYGRTFGRAHATSAYPLWNFDRVCLGEAAYGGPVKFQIANAQPAGKCTLAPEGTLEIDFFEVLPASPGECADPGEVVGGDVEQDPLAWQFELFAREGAPPEGAITRDVGASGSTAVRLTHIQDGIYRRSIARTKLSVPLPDSDMPHPALEFWWRSSVGWRTDVGLGGYTGIQERAYIPELDFLVGDGDAHVTRYCLPPYTFGSAMDLAFELEGGPLGTEGELVVDEVRIVSDAACGTAGHILDPSFDSAPNRWPGASFYASTDPDPGADLRLLNDADRARTGSGALEMRYGSNRAVLSMYQWVFVPAPRGDAWPRVTFYTNIPSEPPGKPVYWGIGNFLTNLDPSCVPGLDCIAELREEELLPGVGWRLGGDCLPTDWTERWVKLTFGVRDYDSSSPTVIYDPPRTVLFDDFEITFDEGCAP
jgi:hypothetical protein